MTFQLPSTDEKADYVLKQFDRIARKYDLVNDLISLGMHRLWKKRAIHELIDGAQTSSNDSGKYLDVCTGTGDLALLIAKQRKGSAVTGIDFSPEMLNVANERMRQYFGNSGGTASNSHGTALNTQETCRPASLTFIQGDAQNLPFEKASFDGAIISFGLRNLTDLQKGLNEMARVVRPGGRVVNLDLGQPSMPIFTPFFLFFFDRIVPLIGELVQQDKKAYTYLPESRKTYPDPQKLSLMFQTAGLIDVRWTSLACGSVALHVGTVPSNHPSKG